MEELRADRSKATGNSGSALCGMPFSLTKGYRALNLCIQSKLCYHFIPKNHL